MSIPRIPYGRYFYMILILSWGLSRVSTGPLHPPDSAPAYSMPHRHLPLALCLGPGWAATATAAKERLIKSVDLY